MVLKQSRQRNTLRQDFESPVCSSDQLRLESKDREVNSQLPRPGVLRGGAGVLSTKATSIGSLVYEKLQQ